MQNLSRPKHYPLIILARRSLIGPQTVSATANCTLLQGHLMADMSIELRMRVLRARPKTQRMAKEPLRSS